MKKWATAFTCAALAAALVIALGLLIARQRTEVSAQSSTPGYAPLPSTYVAPRVAWIGDSWTGGSDMGGRGSLNYSAILSKEFKWRAFNAARGGTGYLAGGSLYSFGSDDRLARLAEDGRFDIVFIVNGFNDYKFPRGKTYAAANTTYQRVQRLLRPGGKLVVIGYVPLREESATVKERNAKLARAASDSGVMFWNPSGRGWLTGRNFAAHIGRDAYHPTDEGHVYLASRVAQLIRSSHLDRMTYVPAATAGPLPGISRNPSQSGSPTESNTTLGTSSPSGPPAPRS